MNAQSSLNNFYQLNESAFQNAIEKHTSFNLNGPLLASPSIYFDQKTKLMVVGQETYGWSQSSNTQDQLDAYVDFNVGQSYNASPFWNFARKLEDTFDIESFSVAWSNLNRFDQNEGSPTDPDVIKTIESFDFILKKEIELLKPDVLVLFTNHKYDSRIEGLYEGVRFEGIPGLKENHFMKLVHPELPAITIRAPHPKTIRMQKWEEDFFSYMDGISKQV